MPREYELGDDAGVARRDNGVTEQVPAEQLTGKVRDDIAAGVDAWIREQANRG